MELNPSSSIRARATSVSEFERALMTDLVRHRYAYKEYYSKFDVDWPTKTHKDIEYFERTWYEFDRENSCATCDENDEIITADVVVADLGELVDSLTTESATYASIAQYLVKLVLCQSQQSNSVTPFAKRTVRDLHFGRWNDPTLKSLVDAVAAVPSMFRDDIPDALLSLTSHVPGFQTNYTSEEFARQQSAGKSMSDAGYRGNGAKALRYRRSSGTKFARVCTSPTHPAVEASHSASYCDPQDPAWDYADAVTGEAAANKAGWALAYATRAASRVAGYSASFVKPSGAWHRAEFGGGIYYASGQAVRRLIARAFAPWRGKFASRTRGPLSFDMFIDSIYRVLPLRRTEVDGTIARRHTALDRYEIDRGKAFPSVADGAPWNAGLDQLTTPYGTLNISRANSIPLYGSLPHFLDADPELQASIIGLHPNRKTHNTVIDLDPRSGVVFHAAERLQFNAVLFDYGLPGLENGLNSIVAKILEGLFPSLHPKCAASNAKWSGFPSRRSKGDDGAAPVRNENGKILPIGYIDREYMLSHDSIVSLDAKLRLVETISNVILDGCLCLAFCFLVVAFLPLRKSAPSPLAP